MTINKYHEPVLVDEISKIIGNNAPLNEEVIDATLGTGGHTEIFLNNNRIVLGIEADELMLKIAKERIGKNKNAVLVNGNFKDIDKISENSNFNNPDIILFDLGVSNLQLTDEERGFSFSNPEALLDMRIDTLKQSVKACDLLNVLREDQLIVLFEKVLDRNLSIRLSKEIIKLRNQKRIEKVKDLNQVCSFLPFKKGLNKATLAFLALRIAVNSEFENLSEALPKAFEILKKGGLLLVISFHSGEDRIVKEYFKSLSEKSLAKVFKMVVPGEEEISKNPRSRSAKLRYIKKYEKFKQ